MHSVVPGSHRFPVCRVALDELAVAGWVVEVRGTVLLIAAGQIAVLSTLGEKAEIEEISVVEGC